MELLYPQSIPCTFSDFPAVLDVRLGNLASALIPGASLGSKLLLYRTPKCGVAQGDYVVGSALPECRMIGRDCAGREMQFRVSGTGPVEITGVTIQALNLGLQRRG